MQKSHSESFRTHYLFLGLYLDLKSGYESRFKNTVKKQKRYRDHYLAFENLSDFIKEKISAEKKEKSINVSMRQFENSFDSFCNNFEHLLKGQSTGYDIEFPDYFLNCYHESNIRKSDYIKKFEEMIVDHPNPFTDVNFVEFIQLLKINYELTGNVKLKNFLMQQMKGMLFPQSKIRKPRKTQKSNNQTDDYFKLRWPKETIYQDQAAYIWTLKYKEKHKDQNPTVDTLMYEYAEEMSTNEEERSYYESFYSVFRREIYPVYHWFVKIYFGDTIPKSFPDILKWNQILLWTFNKLISELVFILGNYVGDEERVNPEIVNKYGLNNPKGLKIDDPGSWSLLNVIPRLKFNNKSKPFYTNIQK